MNTPPTPPAARPRQPRFTPRLAAGLALALAILCIAPFRSWADPIQLVEKPWDQLANHDIGDDGKVALDIRPTAWLHAETPNWILHYRRITEAKRVALEIDFHLGFVAKTLGAKPDQTAHKANVFIFEDDKDWKEFMSKPTRVSTTSPWAVSFAHGQNLFLNVRDGTTGIFDSQRLAHETTHAIVARIYPHQRPPLWLSEGFAEEMSGRSTGARMGQYNQRLLQRSQLPPMALDPLLALKEYPTDILAVGQLYQGSEKLVRFLMTNQPPDHFQKLYEALLTGEDFQTALPRVYADKYPNYAAFTQAFARLPK